MNWVLILSVALASCFAASIILLSAVAGYAKHHRERGDYWHCRYKRLAATVPRPRGGRS